MEPGGARSSPTRRSCPSACSSTSSSATSLATGHWPKLQLVVFNAAVLVAALNWALLPMLHWATRGWAVQAPLVDATLGNHTPRRQGIIDVSAHQ
jgi:hypothetical protein